MSSSVLEQRAFVDQLSRNPDTVNGNLHAVARLITERCAALLGVERVGVWLFDETETELRCIDQFNLSTGIHSSGAVLHENEFRDELQALKSSLYVDANDPLTDPRTAGYVEGYLKPHHITSMLDVVIRFGGRILGTLCFEHVDQAHAWEQHEIDFGCMVGAQLSILLERQALRRAEQARLEAQQRLEATKELEVLKNQFFANISHEFRTPLTLLIGPVEDLLSGARDPVTPWQRAQLESIRRNALRLLKLVNELLDFVRIEAARLKAVFEPTELAGLTRDIAGQFQSMATKAGLHFAVTCAPLSEPVYVDRNLWEKLLVNLLSNAVKYTFEGGIGVELRDASDRVALVVQDTGIGIAAEALPHVFERFYRAPNARGRTMEGSGIGLAMVKEIVQLHGGTVSVASAPGVGSTFTVAIPKGRAHLPAEHVREVAASAEHRDISPLLSDIQGWLDVQPPRAAPEPTGRARILVADDNADMREYLMRLLADRYDVEAVVDGEEALKAARARRPDLVLSDVMMPRRDGLALLRELRADPSTSTVPVLLISARTGEEAAVDALVAGADDYLYKPFSARELLARVGTHLELARARREAAESALKDEFITIASHELMTPLSALKLRIELARSQLEKLKVVHAARQMDEADHALARMERLVEDMLDVNAIKTGRLPVRPAPFDLAAICREAAALMSDVFHRSVTVQLPDRPVEAVVDPARIGEVVEHLLSNALKFSPADQPVILSLREAGDEVEIVVRDFGPGIPAEDVSHLFERFYRVPGLEVQEGSSIGLGLGLYIARAIVDQHAGHIQVDSVVGRGTTVRVTLPRDRSHVARGAEPSVH